MTMFLPGGGLRACEGPVVFARLCPVVIASGQPVSSPGGLPQGPQARGDTHHPQGLHTPARGPKKRPKLPPRTPPKTAPPKPIFEHNAFKDH